MSELPYTRQNHRQPQSVRGINGICIFLAAARLNYRRDARLSGGLYGVAEGEKGVAGEARSLDCVACLFKGKAYALNTVHLPGTRSKEACACSDDDRI